MPYGLAPDVRDDYTPLRDLGPLSDLILQAPSSSAPIVQQIHMTAAHIICELVEAPLFRKLGA